jgi:thioredoxin 1
MKKEFKIFCARYCGKCRALTRRFNELNDRLEGFVITNIDVEQDPDTVDKYYLEGIPTMIYFEDDVEIARLVGSIYEEDIIALIERK